jgi:hypothetical protein
LAATSLLAPTTGEAMVTFIKNYFRKPTPLEMVARELAVAHLCKLEAETAVDYAVSVVRYNDTRIKRLEQHINNHKEQA